MRKLAIVACLLAAAALFWWIQKKPSHTPTVSYPIVEKKPLVVVIPTFNDAGTIEQTLFSVFQQRYENYRVLIIDDHSLDQTVQKIDKCIQYFGAEKITTLVKNSENIGILGCLYNGVHSCYDKEIAVIVLGGDQLATPTALQEVNRAYANPNTWMTYGTSLDYPSFKPTSPSPREIPQKVFSSHLLRKSPWHCGLPFTFYTTLFKEIPIGDLFYRGQFYAMGWEMAVGMPMLELAAGHSTMISPPLYMTNQQSNKRDSKLNPNFYKTCEQHIRSRPFFHPLNRLSSQGNFVQEKADIVLFSNDNPVQLYALLESIKRHVIGHDEIIVYYASSSQPIELGYLEVQVAFPKATFVRYTESLKTELLNRAFSPTFSSSPYIILAQDGVIVSDLIHLGRSIQSLESSKAYGIYFDLHSDLSYSAELGRYQPLPPSTQVDGISYSQPLRAWQLSKGRDDWNNRGSLQFALFRKADLAPQISELTFSTPQELLYSWNLGTHSEIGLFLAEPKAISLEQGEQLQEELEKFLGGLKLDLAPLFQLQPPSREVSINSTFVPR